ncbi:hypothetical protein DUNSADRAFT_18627 [Dunaliella salina]|uniref:Encoded protein n=1 Tax=Dunaliella salina TaxID=3046 RepID=A0ABQ7FZS0_DUNSA|nr:hypothetical protein DUNSADRAFT_18627 [Dunaliella salina]|eukprot:KAF5827851.1 hypothetical protein DUNSADRAFT_18627 [Dunaliella salina]
MPKSTGSKVLFVWHNSGMIASFKCTANGARDVWLLVHTGGDQGSRMIPPECAGLRLHALRKGFLSSRAEVPSVRAAPTELSNLSCTAPSLGASLVFTAAALISAKESFPKALPSRERRQVAWCTRQTTQCQGHLHCCAPSAIQTLQALLPTHSKHSKPSANLRLVLITKVAHHTRVGMPEIKGSLPNIPLRSLGAIQKGPERYLEQTSAFSFDLGCATAALSAPACWVLELPLLAAQKAEGEGKAAAAEDRAGVEERGLGMQDLEGVERGYVDGAVIISHCANP